MRARDIRAIVFCVCATSLVLAVSYLAFRNYFASLVLGVVFGAWLLTRPRMKRLIRRLRGDTDWSGYFKND